MIKSLSDVDIHQICSGKQFFRSPVAWEDQVIYFLLPDRFSDGNERGYKDINGNVVNSGTTPMYNLNDKNEIQTETEKAAWRDAGGKWVGGKIKGVTGKIGYLKRMGVTAIWVGPIFKQVEFQPTYHGYGIQNYLEVDPHFGTTDDLKEMVKTAHDNGIFVILDIILNHTGNIFSYKLDECRCKDENSCTTCWDGKTYNVEGFNNAFGMPSIPFEPINLQDPIWPNDAVWPHEFQRPDFYTRKGYMKNGDNWPEYTEGDFSDLKDITLGYGNIDNYTASPALKALCDVYKYWISLTDIDGFRIDTVKHMDQGAVRYFAQVIHEFAQNIGKENFYLIGEIAGSRSFAFDTLDKTGIDAALGIADVQDKLEYLVKGDRNANDYFDIFTNSIQVGKESHQWFRNTVVTQIDDHDQIRKGSSKARFCANLGLDKAPPLVLNSLALNVTTMGIPCIYYGTEQNFDGSGGNDQYIREAMFGGEFGAFRSRYRHFFNEDNWVYKELSQIIKIRNQSKVLSRGRQYLREISDNGTDFGYPQKMGDKMLSVVPWSRIMVDEEVLLAVNTNADQASRAWVTVDNTIQKPGDRLRCVYCSTDKGKIGEEIIVEDRNGRRAVDMTVPACGFVVYQKANYH